MNLLGLHTENAFGRLPVRVNGVGDGESSGRRERSGAPAKGIGGGRERRNGRVRGIRELGTVSV